MIASKRSHRLSKYLHYYSEHGKKEEDFDYQLGTVNVKHNKIEMIREMLLSSLRGFFQMLTILLPKTKNRPFRKMTYSRKLLILLWCRRRDLNPHGRSPLPPQDSVSTRFHHFGTINLTITFLACCRLPAMPGRGLQKSAQPDEHLA